MMALELEFWYWWIFAGILLFLELFAPGAFFLWLGISAIIVGAVSGLIPSLGWETQVLVFSVLSVLSVVVWRSFQKRQPQQTDQPLLNQRSAQHVGRVFVLQNPIENGEGKIRIGDSIWKIRGDDCEVGAKIEVTGVDGMVLMVKPVE